MTWMNPPGLHWLQIGIHRGDLPSRFHGRKPANGGRGWFRRDVWAIGRWRLIINAMPKA